jgi:hypothetical protein
MNVTRIAAPLIAVVFVIGGCTQAKVRNDVGGDGAPSAVRRSRRAPPRRCPPS